MTDQHTMEQKALQARQAVNVKPTRAPWDTDGVVVWSGNGGGPGICMTRELDRTCGGTFAPVQSEAERRANAQLMSAAPDMHAILDELEGCFDQEIYPQQRKEDFDAPDDRQYTVTITAKQWRAITRALSKAVQL